MCFVGGDDGKNTTQVRGEDNDSEMLPQVNVMVVWSEFVPRVCRLIGDVFLGILHA